MPVVENWAKANTAGAPRVEMTPTLSGHWGVGGLLDSLVGKFVELKTNDQSFFEARVTIVQDGWILLEDDTYVNLANVSWIAVRSPDG
jgi:hypothetical protein